MPFDNNCADHPAPGPSLAELTRTLESLHAEMRQRHVESASIFERVRPGHRQSAANLIDYLTLRQYDLRDIQDALAELGLSSLGRTEEHVIATLERVIDNLHVLAGSGDRPRTETAVSFREGRSILETNTLALLGPLRPGRSTRILVTIPSEAADDYALVTQLMEKGMDCARINCAHDEPAQWERMAQNIRRAAGEVQRACPILMDLPGPKLPATRRPGSFGLAGASSVGRGGQVGFDRRFARRTATIDTGPRRVARDVTHRRPDPLERHQRLAANTRGDIDRRSGRVDRDQRHHVPWHGHQADHDGQARSGGWLAAGAGAGSGPARG